MSNNTTTCDRTSYFLDLAFNTNYVAYNIVAPIYFIFSFSGNGILLLAFLKQLKSERAYMYQVYSATSRTLEVLVRCLLYMDTKVFAVVDLAIVRDSFQISVSYCYLCAWYMAHLASALAAAFTTLSLFLAVSMAADRVLSVLKPLQYRNMRHKRNQLIVLVVSILISFSASAFDTNRGNIVPNAGGGFKSVSNTPFMSLPIVQALALLRIFMQGVAAISLVALSAALCYFYRTKFVNLKAKFASSAEQIKLKENESTLMLITLVECSLTFLGICVVMAYYSFTYCYPIVYRCWKSVAAPIHDTCRMLIDISNFYAVLCFSKRFRLIVEDLLRTWFKGGGQTSSKVVTIASQQTNQTIRW